MVREDEFHRTGFLSDKKGMRLREIVERKCPKNRDFIASRMTPAQIAKAQKLAREWKTKKEMGTAVRGANCPEGIFSELHLLSAG